VFDVSLFESYPLTGRWGYSGLLFHNSINSIFYGIGLIFILEKQKKEWLPIFLFSLALLLLGQKAGMFYLALIVCFAWIKNKTLHVGFLGVGGLLLLTVQYWIPFIVQYNLFWRNVYEKHGAWSVFFSLRNENIQNIFSQMNNISVLDIIIGGTGRFPIRVEMMPFDVLVFFGVLGLFCFTLLIIKIIPNWKWSIPILVACFGGGIYEATLGMLLFLLTLELVKKDEHSYSP
jgi:hypothetical protein